MNPKLHAALGAGAALCVASFWGATVISELFLSHAAVAAVKHAIVLGLWLMIPLMAAAGISGGLLARGRTGRLIQRKALRMRFVAANGLVVMLPCALFLDARAAAGIFDAGFYLMQGLELAVGALQLALLSLNLRDGLALSRRPAAA